MDYFAVNNQKMTITKESYRIERLPRKKNEAKLGDPKLDDASPLQF